MTSFRRPPTVVITGSECTGKTMLAATLAERFGGALSKEFAREYVETRRAALDASDVEPIARGQLAVEQAAEREASEGGRALVIKDTDLHSTVVYARHYYDRCPDWVVEAAGARTADLYLLLCPDVPWVADGLARDRPDEGSRALIHRLFRDTLAAAHANVIEIHGTWAEREVQAVAAVDALIGSDARPSATR